MCPHFFCSFVYFLPVLLRYDDLDWRCFNIFPLKYPENAIKTDENGRKSEINLSLLLLKLCYTTYVLLRSTTWQ